MSWTRALIFLLGLALLAGAAFAAPARAQDSKAIYEQARADYHWLMEHPKAQDVYQNWQSLAERFAGGLHRQPQGYASAGRPAVDGPYPRPGLAAFQARRTTSTKRWTCTPAW